MSVTTELRGQQGSVPIAEKRLPAARILLIEDDREVSDALSEVLRKAGYQVQQAFDGRDGLTTAISHNFHLVLLDKLLPQMDGLEVLNRLRRYRDTPVMMLTACGAEAERIAGFSSGADDYLAKPFNITELRLRIEALLRRSMRPVQPEPPGSDMLKDGALQLDTRKRIACCGQQQMGLTPIEYELLEELLRHPDEVLSKPYLYHRILNKPYSRYDRSLDMHISNLRAKLTDVLPERQLIKTVRGQGYCYQ